MNVVISGSEYTNPDELPKSIRRTALIAQAIHGDVVFVVQHMEFLYGVFLCVDNNIVEEAYGNTELQAWGELGRNVAQQLLNVVMAE